MKSEVRSRLATPGKLVALLLLCFILFILYVIMTPKTGPGLFYVKNTLISLPKANIGGLKNLVTDIRDNTPSTQLLSTRFTNIYSDFAMQAIDRAKETGIEMVGRNDFPTDRKAVFAGNATHQILSNKKIVIILAYMRTGSTLTASVFQEYPGSFYVFEPLHFIQQSFLNAKKRNQTSVTFTYTHGRSRNVTISERHEVEMEEINNWFTCRLDAISIRSLTDDFHKAYTKIMKYFYNCARIPLARVAKFAMRMRALQVDPRLRSYYDHSVRLDVCLKAAMTSCQNAPFIILKFIRLKMEDLEDILPLYPNMKIIHLVRDPRAIMNSRMMVKVVSSTEFKQHVSSLCSDVSDNLKHSKTVLQKYPDRLKFVFYEDLAERPDETAKEMVIFTGLEFTKQMKSFLDSQTSSSRDTCAFCTQRKNSNATSNKWRQELPFNISTYIYDTCKLSNTILGYVPFSSNSSQTNLNNPSRKKIDVHRELVLNSEH